MGKSKRVASRSKKQPAPKTGNASQYWSYAWLSLVILFFAAIRFRLRSMPLERDEGEYAYIGQLMLQGIPPYKLAYTMKLPGTQAAYALLMAIFGQTPQGIRIGVLLLNAATTVLVYLLGKRLADRLSGVVAAACYALLSTSFTVLGLSAHATHFVVFFAVAGILVLLNAIERKRVWLFPCSGVLLGLAFLMKQPGIVFAAFGGLYLVHSEWGQTIDWKSLLSKAGAYIAGLALPFATTCLILRSAGVFQKFWFWVFTYASTYASENSLSTGISEFMRNFPAAMGPSVGIWIMAAVGLSALVWHQATRRHAIFAGGLFFFSFLGVCPGLYFRSHYFILLLPAVAILAGLAVHATREMAQERNPELSAVPMILFLVFFGYSVIGQRISLFELDPVQAVQKRYRGNPFPEAIEVAHYLETHTAASDQIAVLGSEPEICFYAKRHSATGFIYMYELVERQKYADEMAKQMMREIESARPKYFVSVRSRLSWAPQAGSEELHTIFAWANGFLRDYELVGVADAVGDHTEYRWDADAKTYKPHSSEIMTVFRRKD